MQELLNNSGGAMRVRYDSPGQRTFDDLPHTQPDENIVVRCPVCRRPLRTQASRERGVGPRCAKKQEADSSEDPES